MRAVFRSIRNRVRIVSLVDWFREYRATELHLVSATDDSHHRSALQLIESIRRNCPEASFVLYDLGLSQANRAELIQRNVSLKEFHFDRYPDFFQMTVNHGSYAWKPAIVELEMERSDKPYLVWLDAGCVVGKSFAKIGSLIRRHKIVANPSASTYKDWLHPRAAAAYQSSQIATREQLASRIDEVMLSAAFLGFATAEASVRNVIAGWAFFAHSRDLIGPSGSSVVNHRFDQVLLDAVIRRSDTPHFPYRDAWLPAGLVGIRTHMDVDSISNE